MKTYKQRQVEDRARVDRDMADHRMSIVRDEGLNRHIRMARPGTSNLHFDIVTYPGYLVFSGDVGCYVFSRLRDMFDFHRINWDREALTIDYCYWAEKVQAAGKHGGLTDFDNDAYMQAIREEVNQYLDARGFGLSEAKEIVWDARENLFISPSDEREATEMAMGWRCPVTGDRPFCDFYEHRLTRPSLRFRWACWAIAKTIRDYDRGGDRWTRQQAHDQRVLTGIRREGRAV